MSKIRDDAKKLIGVPPFDGGENIVRGDGYFAKGCAREHGEAAFRAECEEVRRLWGAVCTAFMDLETETQRGRENNEDGQ